MNYINEVSIYGMMNRFSSLSSNLPLTFYKTKNKKNIVVFNDAPVDSESSYDTISYMYLNELPSNATKYNTMPEIVSVIDPTKMFIELPGKEYKEYRYTRNYWMDRIDVHELSLVNLDDVMHMIEDWRYSDDGGKKYGWVEHAAIDKNIVNMYCNNDDNLRDKIIGLVFYYERQCVGYSMIERKPTIENDGHPMYRYITRKVSLFDDARNLTEYIDWYTFMNLNANGEFLINWGCSSGGVKWYKMHKWPLYSADYKYFYKVNNKKQNERQTNK